MLMTMLHYKEQVKEDFKKLFRNKVACMVLILNKFIYFA